jgi:hypothetical protein
MESLSDLLRQRLDNHHLSASATSAEIVHAANQALQRAFPQAPHSVHAYRLEDSKLFVSAENPVLAQEFWGIQNKLLRNLQSMFGEKKVNKIIIKWFDNSESLE